DWYSNFRMLTDKYLYAANVDGNKYFCSDIAKLDKKSLAVLEIYISLYIFSLIKKGVHSYINLLLEAPRMTSLDDFLFALPFNLYGNAKKVKGDLCVTRDKKILVYVNDKLEKTYDFDDYDEYACEQLVGCSMMVGRKNDVTQMC